MENYKLLAWCYKTNSKSNPSREATAADISCSHTFKYLNCKRNYTVDDNKCLFWYYHFDKKWYANKAVKVCSEHANCSTITGPSGGSQ